LAPNQSAYATPTTPATRSIRDAYDIGSGSMME